MTTTVDRSDPAAEQPATNTRPLGRVLVTGAASGLGRAVADAVAAAGGSPLRLDRVTSTTAGGGGRAVVVDIADTRAAERAVAELAADAGGLDAVVTAAGTDSCGRLEDVPGAE